MLERIDRDGFVVLSPSTIVAAALLESVSDTSVKLTFDGAQGTGLMKLLEMYHRWDVMGRPEGPIGCAPAGNETLG